MPMLAGSAVAQTTAPASTNAIVPSSQSEKDANLGQLDEIIITAQKRSENLQRVAGAVTAISPKQLDDLGISSVRGIQDFVPDLQISSNGPFTEINIRGISSVNDMASGDPAAAFNLDGIYLARPSAPDSLLFDISRVEVLRGPQGTLYGRNADAGAINVVTNKPTTDFGGDAELELGDYNMRREMGALNLPISDTLAVRGAFQFVNHDGYVSNGTSDEDVKAGRVHLLWTPDENTSLLVSGDYSERGGLGSQQVISISPRNYSDPWQATWPSTGDRLHAVDWGITVNANRDLGFATATLLYGHRSDLLNQGTVGSGGVYTLSDGLSITNSIEARLSSPTSDRVTWTGGIYYFRERQRYNAGFQLNDTIPELETYFNYPDLTTTSIAGFGQATYSILPTLRLTGGVRYTSDNKQSQEGNFGVATFNGSGSQQIGFPLSAVPADVNNTWNDVSWKGGVEYDFAPTVLGYVNVAKGYKAGGFSPGVPPDNIYQPETLIAYSGGLKSRFLDNALQFNAEAFYWNYSNYQNTALTFLPPPNAPGQLALVTFNAGKARIYGLETETSWRATVNDRFDVILSYLNATFVDFEVPGLPGVQTGDFAGNSLIHAPKNSGTVSYGHTFHLPGDSRLEANAMLHFEASQALLYYYNRIPGSGVVQPSYTMSNVAMTWHSPSDRYRLTGYIKNIENRAVANEASMAPNIPNVFGAELDPPRTFGFIFGVSW